MSDPTVIQRLVADVARQIRLRRAEFYGLRGLFWGAVAAVVPLLLKETLGPWSYALAGLLLLAGAAAGAAWGLLLSLPPAEAARLADRGYGLQERISTALEWADRRDRTPIVDALVTDAAARAGQVGVRRIIPRRLPREAKLVPVPLVLGLVLAAAPPIPLPQGRLPSFSVSRDEDEEKTPGDRSGDVQQSERKQATRRDPVQRTDVQERTLSPRLGGGGQSQPGDLAAVFKDTSLGGRAPDFNSFLKKGDERLRMLDSLDRLPDLQSDFTQNQTRMVFQKAKALRGGLDPNKKVSPEKLRELLSEMERLGRKNGGQGQGNWSGDAYEGMEALEGGQSDKAMEAMERALNKMRSMEERGRDGKGLKGGRERERRGARRGDKGAGQQGGGPGDEGDFPEGEGLLPGRGKSGAPKGDPTARLRGSPFDVGVEGESRPGRKQGIDTNMVGRGGQMPSRMQYMGVLGQYRKMMEESIAREQVPRDFQSQVKEYFQSLDEK
jgi:hypothetical protein